MVTLSPSACVILNEVKNLHFSCLRVNSAKSLCYEKAGPSFHSGRHLPEYFRYNLHIVQCHEVNAVNTSF